MSRSASSDIVTAAFALISRCTHIEERCVFELLAAVAGAKPLVRVHLENLDEYAAVSEFALKTGLFFAHASTRNKLAWTNTIGDSFFTTVDWNHPEGGSFAAYVALDNAVLEAAVNIERCGTALDAGLLLGYPRCCCEGYARIEDGDYWITALAAASHLAAYPFWGNKYAYLLHGTSLFPDYFPCNLGCKDTHHLGQLFAEIGLSFGLDGLVAHYESRMREPVLLSHGAVRSGGVTYEWQKGGADRLPEPFAAAIAISRREPTIENTAGVAARIFYFE